MVNKSNNIQNEYKAKMKQSVFWNAVLSASVALQPIIMLAVVIRINGVHEAGYFSIGNAIANLTIYIGLFGMRKYQASDINQEFSFSDYHTSRVITCMAMVIIVLVYCVYQYFFNGYSLYKSSIVLLICLVKGIQAYVDVINGAFQQCGRLDIACKASIIRLTIETVVFSCILCLCRNLLIAMIVCFVVSIIVMFITSYNISKKFFEFKIKQSEKVKVLLIKTLPLFICLLLSAYLTNLPKYYIDANLSESIQTYYNILFMPTFAINMVTLFIFDPMINVYSKVWIEGYVNNFKKLIYKQLVFIAAITILGIVVAYFIGIPILSYIFDVNLEGYGNELCLIMLGGGLFACAYFLTNVITIIRAHKYLLIGYIGTCIVVLILKSWISDSQGIMGACLLYTLTMTILTVFFVSVTVIKICLRRKENGEA